jgi:hypothetical protein
MERIDISDLIGKIITKFDIIDNEQISIVTSDGSYYEIYHEQDCCENVSIEDINGDIEDLKNSPIIIAEEVTSDENPIGIVKEYQDSFTWTFYKFATIKGYVTIRWYGESNGYYSESVDFFKSN